jgi:hypothetical protein
VAADEIRKYVDELQRVREEDLDNLKRLEIARTGPVKHVGTAFVLAPLPNDLRRLQTSFRCVA